MSTQTPNLRTAAQAVIDRWETPLWKDVPATAEYIAALRDALEADHFEGKLDMVGRWYMVTWDGAATLCVDREDAEMEAKNADMAWPLSGPHRAVRLVEAADMEALRAGYAAARLEIASLQARIKTMAEEHADELAVAHLDWRMRAAQPAGARTPWDYAIEHAEYMAKKAERLIDGINELTFAEQCRENLEYDEPEGVIDAADHAVESAKELVSERMSSMRNGIYEFRKRRDRAAAQPAGAQQPAKAESLRQILTDPENQPNQYGVQFLMHGAKMAFRIGNRQFCLDYEPDEPGEFEFMRDALISAFSIFTPDVKLAQQPSPTPQADSAPADSVLEDAARWRWLRQHWFTMSSSYQGGITFKLGEPRWSDITEAELDAAIDSARKQGANHD